MNFPVSRVFGPESGSHQTQSSARSYWKRWAFGEPTPFEAGRPSGCERSTRSASASLERWLSQVYGTRAPPHKHGPVCGDPGLKARAPSGAAGSNPRSLRHDGHVRQIRLAAAVRKTATLSGSGGSNPLTCTRLVLAFVESGVVKRSISQP